MRTPGGASAHPLRLSAAHRLTKPAEFARVLAAAPSAALRATGVFLAMKAVRGTAAVPRVRLGITVGKRHARRAVDRSLVKRMVRESFRAALPDLQARVGAEAMDISIRLVAPLRATEATRLVGATQLRRTLRGDVDRLFDGLTRRLTAPPAAHD